jgi:hypothetical protein
MGSDKPSFEQGDFTVNPRHQLGGSPLLALEKCNLVLIALAFQRQISQPAIGVDDTAWRDRILYKRHKA